jgi:hypothetical protein
MPTAPRSSAHARPRCDARGGHDSVRQELAAEVESRSMRRPIPQAAIPQVMAAIMFLYLFHPVLHL